MVEGDGGHGESVGIGLVQRGVVGGSDVHGEGVRRARRGQRFQRGGDIQAHLAHAAGRQGDAGVGARPTRTIRAAEDEPALRQTADRDPEGVRSGGGVGDVHGEGRAGELQLAVVGIPRQPPPSGSPL